MFKRGSVAAALIGRWGMALTLTVGAVLVGRLIRRFPHLMPNRLPGLILYELAPALVLAVAIGSAIILTRADARHLGLASRLALFTLTALLTGTVALMIEFDAALRGRWL